MNISLLERPQAPQTPLSPVFLEVLATTGHLLLQDSDPDTICQAVFNAIRGPLRINVYFHYLVVPDGSHLELVSSGGNDYIRSLLGTPLDFGQAVCGTAAQRCASMHITGIQSRSDDMTSLIRSVGTRCYSCSPLIKDGQCLGTLSFGSTERNSFDPEEIELFHLIAQQVTLATARRQQQQHLRKIEQLATAGRMSAALAHEINNPLESLSTALYLLRDELPSGHARELLETAESQVARLTETSRRTLEMFRGQMPQAQPLNLSHLTEDLLADIRLPRDVQLQTTIEPGLCVRGVAGELRQVLFNLLLNAASYTPPGSAVTLTVHRAGNEAEIRVRDEGLGIPAAIQSQIFQPFYTTRQNGGTGLGLWISREMVERYGGSLTFDSAPELRPGTEFIARLPLIS